MFSSVNGNFELMFKRAYLCNCTAVFLKNFSFYVELALKNFWVKHSLNFVSLNPTYNHF